MTQQPWRRASRRMLRRRVSCCASHGSARAAARPSAAANAERHDALHNGTQIKQQGAPAPATRILPRPKGSCPGHPDPAP
eukprot:CAMPEP_0204368250 /NCGR_PEP_ID=MMETSP0469-20131031/44048_1 /ASSEMBLY_ACC=CAM_ASM_000384 /TAXON_ID=2969 /ORGANISM="Oxyrrhis marina" /LENGTH=79 /DNA_ID=CAMNT_0051357787 /DNA_START=61 /DNA_END=296 /DNA_ORIENTATION=-